MIELGKLKKITQELAKEIEAPEDDGILDLLRMIFDQIHTGISVISKDHRLVYLNPVLRETIGRDIDMGKKCFEAIEGRNSPCPHCPVEKVLSSRKVEILEYTPPSSKRCYVVTCIPLLANGATGVIQIMREREDVGDN